MKSLLRFSLILLLPTLAFAADNPVITSIIPSFGPTTGGTEVTITGDHFGANIVCVLPCPMKVRFGDVDVEPKSESETKIVVVTPAHAAGVVDVSVTSRDGRTGTKPNGFAFGNTSQAGYETLLLPIYLDGRVNGANGTQWQTDLWVRNGNATNATLAPWDCPAGQICPAVFPLTKVLSAGESMHNLPAFFRPPTANPARLLYVSRAEAEAMQFQLRFSDASRSTQNSGTELPVIHEEELFAGTATLLNVPVESKFRILLRVFDVALTESQFRVTIYAQETGTGNTVLQTRDLTATSSDSGDFRLTPGYAQLGIEGLDVNQKAVRIEVTPLTAGSRFWTFASITNNDTQLVTLVTPQ